MGWGTARHDAALSGFVNVLWDGLVHAWIQNVMTAASSRRTGVGSRMVALARDEAEAAGCEWLHVDFDDDLRSFSVDACGFTPANGGLIDLMQASQLPPGRRLDQQPRVRPWLPYRPVGTPGS
ncbi:MAG: GNAT family N-acetyltransferase [Acidimicrobiia bacterium]